MCAFREKRALSTLLPLPSAVMQLPSSPPSLWASLEALPLHARRYYVLFDQHLTSLAVRYAKLDPGADEGEQLEATIYEVKLAGFFAVLALFLAVIVALIWRANSETLSEIYYRPQLFEIKAERVAPSLAHPVQLPPEKAATETAPQSRPRMRVLKPPPAAAAAAPSSVRLTEEFAQIPTSNEHVLEGNDCNEGCKAEGPSEETGGTCSGSDPAIAASSSTGSASVQAHEEQQNMRKNLETATRQMLEVLSATSGGARQPHRPDAAAKTSGSSSPREAFPSSSSALLATAPSSMQQNHQRLGITLAFPSHVVAASSFTSSSSAESHFSSEVTTMDAAAASGSASPGQGVPSSCAGGGDGDGDAAAWRPPFLSTATTTNAAASSGSQDTHGDGSTGGSGLSCPSFSSPGSGVAVLVQTPERRQEKSPFPSPSQGRGLAAAGVSAPTSPSGAFQQSFVARERETTPAADRRDGDLASSIFRPVSAVGAVSQHQHASALEGSTTPTAATTFRSNDDIGGDGRTQTASPSMLAPRDSLLNSAGAEGDGDSASGADAAGQSDDDEGEKEGDDTITGLTERSESAASLGLRSPSPTLQAVPANLLRRAESGVDWI